MNRAPRRENGDHPEKRGEHDEQQADTIDAEMVFRADGRDPLGGFLEGKGLLPGIPPAKQGKRNQKAERAKMLPAILCACSLSRGMKSSNKAPTSGVNKTTLK